MQTKFVCVLTCAPEAMYNPPEKSNNLAKAKRVVHLQAQTT